MLYRADWHEPLTDRTWDEAWMHDALVALVDDAVAAYDADELWPADEWDAFGTKPPVQDVFVGAAGVIWALHRLGADFDAPAAAARPLISLQWRDGRRTRGAAALADHGTPRAPARTLPRQRDERGERADDRRFGPIHGLVGNVFALAGDDRAREILRAHALRAGRHVNWPPAIDAHKLPCSGATAHPGSS